MIEIHARDVVDRLEGGREMASIKVPGKITPPTQNHRHMHKVLVGRNQEEMDVEKQRRFTATRNTMTNEKPLARQPCLTPWSY